MHSITVDVVLVGFVVGHVPNDDVRVEARADAVVTVGAHDKREHWTGVFSKRVDGLNIRVGVSKTTTKFSQSLFKFTTKNLCCYFLLFWEILSRFHSLMVSSSEPESRTDSMG